jgi:hypothetical protein
LWQADFVNQFGITRIGTQGIELEIGGKADQVAVVLLVCGMERVFLIASGIEPSLKPSAKPKFHQ